MDLGRAAKVSREAHGHVRRLSHARRPVTAAELEVGVDSLSEFAAAYLSEVYGELEPDFKGIQSGERALTLGPPREIQSRRDLAVLHLSQLYHGIPICDSGLDVRFRGKPLAITGMESTLVYDLDAELPEDESALGPEQLQTEQLARLLGRHGPGAPAIKESRWVVCRYESETRELHPEPSPYDLPPVPVSLEPGRYYVVNEVLFVDQLEPDSEPLAWRTHIEPKTGAVLRLEAQISPETV